MRILGGVGWRARVEKFMLTLLCDRLHNDRIMEADAGTPGPRAQTAGRIATGNSPGFKGRFYHQEVHGSIQQWKAWAVKHGSV